LTKKKHEKKEGGKKEKKRKGKPGGEGGRKTFKAQNVFRLVKILTLTNTFAPLLLAKAYPLQLRVFNAHQTYV